MKVFRVQFDILAVDGHQTFLVKANSPAEAIDNVHDAEFSVFEDEHVEVHSVVHSVGRPQVLEEVPPEAFDEATAAL